MPARKQLVVTTGAQQYRLLADLGIVAVPESYERATCLASFREKGLCRCHEAITDENFANATTQLVPGQKLWVRAFLQRRRFGWSEQHLEFLERKKALFVSAQGLSVILEQEQVRNQLPKGK